MKSVLLLLFGLAVGCGSSIRGMEPSITPVLASIPTDHARVVFLRPSRLGHKISFPILDSSGQFVGATRGGMQFSITVSPGEHRFYTWAENEDAVILNVEAGRTYFVIQRPHMGWTRARLTMEVLGRAHENFGELRGWLRDLPVYQPNRLDGAAWIIENQERVQAKFTAAQVALIDLEGERLASHSCRPEDGLLPEELP